MLIRVLFPQFLPIFDSIFFRIFDSWFVLGFLLFDGLGRRFCLLKFELASFDGVQDPSDGWIVTNASVDGNGKEVQALLSILLLQTPASKY